MADVFTKASSVGSVITRRAQSRASGRFSPSFAVHRGLIKDPNWPPAQFPEHGTAAARRFRRVELEFGVELRGGSATVRGDVSEGGAMFVLGRRVDTPYVDVVVKGQVARAEVLSTSRRGEGVAHHCRFIDAAEALPVWQAASTA